MAFRRLTRHLRAVITDTETYIMYKIHTYLPLLILAFCVSCNGNPLGTDIKIKSPEQLSISEQGALDSLMHRAYQEALGENIVAFYRTTYYYHPITNQELSPPMELVTISTTVPMSDIQKDVLSKKIAIKIITWEENGKERRLEIMRFSIKRERSIGSSWRSSGEAIAVIPSKIEIR